MVKGIHLIVGPGQSWVTLGVSLELGSVHPQTLASLISTASGPNKNGMVGCDDRERPL